MKKNKKAPKREAPKTKSTSKAPASQELSERELDTVAGGAAVATGGAVSAAAGTSGPSAGWIELDSFQFGVGRSSSTGSQSGGGGREGSAPSVSEITITK